MPETLATALPEPVLGPQNAVSGPGDTPATPRTALPPERLLALFGAEADFYGALPEETASQVREQIGATPDPARERARIAITAFLADRTGLAPQQVARRYDSLRASFSAQMFPDLPPDADETAFAGEVRKLLEREKTERETLATINRTLFTAAVEGRDFSAAWEAAQAAAPNLPPERRDLFNAWAVQRWEQNRAEAARLAPSIDAVSDLMVLARESPALVRTGDVKPQLERALDLLGGLGEDERGTVLALAAERAERTAQAEGSAAQKAEAAFLVGTSDLVSSALVGLWESADALAEVTGLPGPSDNPAGQRFIARHKLERELLGVINGEIDPIKSDSFAGQVALDFVRSTPAMLAAMTTAGLAVDFFALKQESRDALEAQGATPGAAELTATIQAIPKTALFFAQSKMIFAGRVPKAFGTSIPVTLGVEFVGNFALNEAGFLTDAGIQAIARALTEDVPEVDWGEFGRAFVDRLPQQLAFAIPGALIGTGVATFRNRRAGQRYLQDPELLDNLGFTEEAKAAVLEAPDYVTTERAFKEGFAERKPPPAPEPVTTVEPLGRRFLVAEGVGEPVEQFQVRRPGDDRGLTMTRAQLEAEGIPIPPETLTDIADVRAMDGAQFAAWDAKQPGGFTGAALRLGQAVRGSQEINALLAAEAEALAQAEAAKASMPKGDMDALQAVMALASKAQFFREAYEAALGEGSAGLNLRQADPNFMPPVVRQPDGTYRVQATPEAPPVTAATPEGAALVAQAQRLEADQTAATAPPEAHPEQDGRALPPRVTALNKESIRALRAVFNLDELPPPQRERFIQVLDEAKRTDAAQNAEMIAADILATRRMATAAEHAAMVLKSAELQNRYEQVANEIGEAFAAGDQAKGDALRTVADNLQRDLDTLTEASDLAGTQIARALSIRRMRLNRDDYTLARVVQRMRAAKRADLSPEQQAHLKALTDELSEQQRIIAEQRNQLAALELEKAKAQAETFVAEGRRRRRQAVAGDAAARRAALKKEALALGYRVNDITNVVGLSYEMARIVAKIADTYIEEGVASLAELTNKLKADLPDLSDQDIFLAVGRQTRKEAKKIEAEAQRRVKELRTQAALWAKINAALEGNRPDGSPLNRQQQHRLLRETLRELRRQANRTTFDDAALKRVDAKILEIQRALETGERNLRAKAAKREPGEPLKRAREALKELRQEMGALDTIEELESLIGEETAPAPGPGEPRPEPRPPTGQRLKALRERIAELRKQIAESPEQRAAQAELDALAKRYSDTQAWPEQRTNAVRDAIAAQRASPMPSAEFAATLEAFGVDAATAQNLAGAMEIEQRARETRADLRRTEQLETTLADLEEQLRTGETPEKAEKPADTNARRNEMRERIAELRRQIARANVDPAAVNAERLARLQRLAAELEAQVEGGFREIREPTRRVPDTAAVEAVRKQVRELQAIMRTEDAIADLEQQLRTGEFKVSPPEQRILTNARLEKAQIRQKQLRRQIDQAIEAARPKTIVGRGVEVLLAVRALQTTADLGTLFRQLGILANPLRRPKLFARTAVAGVKALLDENTADAIQLAIENRPGALAGQRAKLFLSDVGGNLAAREEYFQSQLAERIPGWGRVVRASNRSMTVSLNLVRAAVFDDFVARHPDATPQQREAFAWYINAASGRGNMRLTANQAKVLTAVFFAPRYAVSRFQTLYAPFRSWKDKTVRNEILKDFAAYVTTGSIMLLLSELGGAEEVSLDPSESDFGKIVIDDTRIDVWGGLQQPARLMLQAAILPAQEAGLVELERDIDPLEAASQFLKYKLSPAITVPMTLIRGENIIGQEQGRVETLLRSVTPLTVQEGLDVATENESIAAGLAAFAAGGVGFGIQQHE